jgi:two-component system, LytTR family, response regulator
MIRSILVDDEARSRKTLEWQLNQYCPEIEIITSCASAEEGILAINNFKPELVFLDIEMPHMNGFEMLQNLQPVNFAVIFTTAYDQFAIKAFRYSAADYLLKPIDKDDLQEAVEKVKKLYNENHHDKIGMLLEQVKLLSQGQSVQKIALTTHDSYVFVDVADMIYCESERNYTRVFLASGKNIIVAKTLKLVEELIASNNFFRAHHSYLINMNNIKQFIKEDGGQIVMKNDAKIPLSRGKRDEFFALFSKL